MAKKEGLLHKLLPNVRRVRFEAPTGHEIIRRRLSEPGTANFIRLIEDLRNRDMSSWELWNSGVDENDIAAVQDIDWAYNEKPGDEYNTLTADDRVGRSSNPGAIYVRKTNTSLSTVVVLELWWFES